jgi:transposase-like protein
MTKNLSNLSDEQILGIAKRRWLDESIGFCPDCDNFKHFSRTDKGIALVGTYKCDSCNAVYSEVEIYPTHDFEELIAGRLKQRNGEK